MLQVSGRNAVTPSDRAGGGGHAAQEAGGRVARKRWQTWLPGVVGGCALALSLMVVGQAQALVYWGGGDFGQVGRAQLDGSDVQDSFVAGNPACQRCSGVGVAVDSGHVYSTPGGQIGRANLDGTGATNSFILPPDGGGATGVAVDASHVYWAEGSGSIGRANLDGTGADSSFITIGDSLESVAVDGGHVYWTDTINSTIGRANLDGTGVNDSFIAEDGDDETGLAVDASHVYWSDPSAGSIARANLDGTGVDVSFITAPGAPGSVAVDAGHVYWTDDDIGTIGRANLDGSAVNDSFIAGVAGLGLAVDARALRSTSTAVSCSPAQVNPGATSTCTATVTDTAAGTAGSPAGQVQFAAIAGASYQCTLIAGAAGSASCSIAAGTDQSGTYVVSASYTPGGTFFVPLADGVHASSASSGAGNGSVTILAADTAAPQTTITLSPSSPGGLNGWYVSSVHATVSASDPGGSVAATRCVLDPASYDAMPSGCAFGGSGAEVTADGRHVIYAASIDAAGNKEVPVARSFKIDGTAPSVTCGTADGQWHASNVSIACTASDGGSGLASAGDASFSLSTSVAAGSETANAATGSRQVCDSAGNCATAGPVTGNKVDRKGPTITLTRPANGARYSFIGTLLAPVKVSYSCSDAGSGLASCTGTQPNGATLDTGARAVGTHTFTVTATDKTGNTTTVTSTYTVTFF